MLQSVSSFLLGRLESVSFILKVVKVEKITQCVNLSLRQGGYRVCHYTICHTLFKVKKCLRMAILSSR